MKNTQRGFVGILATIIIVIVIVGGGIYLYSIQKTNSNIPVSQADNSLTSSSTASDAIVTSTKSNTKSLSDAQFMSAVGENATKVRARGDINGDGYEDAIVEETHCGGASCSVGLYVVFNEKNSIAKLFDPTQYPPFEPAYRGSSAVKSNITNITIKNGVISLTGTALDCPSSICDEAHQKIVRTVTYKFDGKNIVQLSVNPPLELPLISKGQYQFSEFARGLNGETQTWSYKMNIKNEGGVGQISLTVDGFQTMTNIYAMGSMSSQGSLDVVFDSYGQDNNFTPYKKGDVLFTLKPTYSGPSIEWKKMQPALEKTTGGNFVKI